jgi:saccharopine dehydrogenase-like NADP-dependent oxidoreductase
LFDEWKLGEDEAELTVMRVSLKGSDDTGQVHEVVYHLLDAYDPVSGTSSMARTTGYTATAAANMFLDGHFREPGVYPPELIGHKEGCFEYILAYLKQRGVIYSKTERVL